MTEQDKLTLHMNELAQGPLFAASTREQYRSGDLCVTFTTTAREGATADMLNETKRHFLETAKAVYELRSFASTDEQWSKRTEWSPVQAPHGEPRVNIFGDMLVRVGDKHVSVSVNKFTEYTTAFDMARHLYRVAESVRLPIGGQSPKPAPKYAAREPAPASTPAPDAQSDSGTPHFAEFPQNAEARAAFGAEYGGKVVSFTARKVEKKFDANTGDPEWHFYELPTHQYPMVRSTLAYIRDEATKAYLPTLPNSIEGEWRVVVYVAAKDTGKVYFNVNKVEPLTGTPQPAAAPKTVAQSFMNDYGLTDVPPYGDGPGEQDAAEDDVPF